MYAARIVVVFLLILAFLVSYSPRAREDVAEFWERIRPGVVKFMDGFYVAIRDLFDDKGGNDPIDGTPVPDPGVNFQRIVTMNGGSSL